MSQAYAGAFEGQGIAGVSFARGADALGIRLACPQVSLGLFDGKPILLTLDPPETHAPDQGYVRYSWQAPVTRDGIKRFAGRPYSNVNAPNVFHFAPGEAVRVTLEWRQEGDVVRGRYTADGPLRAALFANGCFAPARIHIADPTICVLLQGASGLLVKLHGAVEAPLLVDDLWQAEQRFFGVEIEPGSAMALYPVHLSPDTPLHFTLRCAALEEKMSVLSPEPDPAAIDAALAEGAAAYDAARMRSTGGLAGAAKAVAGLTGYSRAYDPAHRCPQTTVNRTWPGPNRPGCIFGWDNFFTSYIAAWESPAVAAASLEHAVGTYGEHGIAHGPTQRNLIIPIIYCRTLDVLGDVALARRTWSTMMAFLRFWFEDRGDGRPWRDGNGDGLIESGVSTDPRHTTPGRLISDAMDETGYDDSPIYSAGFTDGRRGLLADGVEFDAESRCLTVTQIGQNSLYVAACRTMARWAARLEMAEDAAWLRAEEARVAGRIRAYLYDERLGIYQDRLWSGTFSQVKTMTNFYPLLAGLAEGEVTERLQAMLLDPAQFWGDNLIPTVSRDDPAYCDGLDGAGNYWRGNCWPPTTYIVYLALKEAGWDEVAAAYARRVVAQFMAYWRAHGHAYENYPPEGTVDHRFPYVGGWGGREVRYTWAAMLLFCGLEELFGPEIRQPGLRFGNPHMEESTWSAFTFEGQRFDATAGPARTHVRCDAWEFLAEPGLAVRGFVQDADGIRFTAAPQAATTVHLRADLLTEPVTVTGNAIVLPAAREDGALVFTLPAGAAAVAIVPARLASATGAR
jgi:hypothetical protein